MRIISFLIAFITLAISCNKGSACMSAEITKTIIKSCSIDTVWAVKVNNKNYPADKYDSIPLAFQQEGIKVCIKYNIATYNYYCPCCYNGPFAKILSISKAE